MKTSRFLLMLAAFGLAANVASIRAQGTTSFNYQGRLADGGSPANGNYRISFALFGASMFGNPVGGPITNQVAVANGLFSVSLDFGAVAFDGAPRWLEITVLGTNNESVVVLVPRQQIGPVPYSLFAPKAGTVTNGAITSAQIANNAVATVQVQDNAITAAKISAGQVVRSINGLQDNVSLSASGGIQLSTNGGGLVLTGADTAWSRGGNGGTTAGLNFLGTTDNQAFEVKVNNTRALRIVPSADQPNYIGGPNIVGGAGVNSVASGLQGATIAGGGLISLFGTPYPNRILSVSDYATIGGGLGNTISSNSAESTISGGNQNTIYSNSFRSVIGGGYRNYVGTNCNTSTISGGVDNSAGSNATFVGGGTGNRANGSSSVVAGGYDNAAAGAIGFVGGGARNRASASGAAVVGGDGNVASGDNSAVGGGYINNASGPSASIGGGVANSATADSATVPGGSDNSAQGRHSFAAGRGAQALHDGSFVWADRQGTVLNPTLFQSTAANQFRVRASGGVSIEGEVKLGSSAQYFAPGGDENLRIIRGTVSAAGAIERGAGFSVTRLGTGTYRMTFNTPFAGGPTVTANTGAYTFNGAGIGFVGTNYFEVAIHFSETGPLQDSQFHFIAIGPR